jgi:hypothetical protein
MLCTGLYSAWLCDDDGDPLIAAVAETNRATTVTPEIATTPDIFLDNILLSPVDARHGLTQLCRPDAMRRRATRASLLGM